MLDTILTSTTAEAFTLGGALTVVLSSLILGLFISLVYIQTHQQEGYAGSFAVTLIMLPAIIAVIILLVGNNVARAFSLAGAFSLIRFRSAPGDPKDIAYVFFTLAVGLACGMGFIAYAAIFAVILCLVMVLITLTRYGVSTSPKMQLKITIPEDLNYHGHFDDIFDTYLSDYRLVRVKTTDFGSLFELCYRVAMVNPDSQKELIDDIRKRNGNLNIVLSLTENHDWGS
ncbi:DUF4956 domain-containing protein [Anoxynatronum buryatiense]|uniref:DUF4956 domain-containing protein n=1 Tax=Anoxynatronum buryatiense TaxID=489973 RepID=A0AA46AK18_9CLOT|nr:DUF4956 domain-containing protein [Anoxynatronum buryatiense]SMP65304.1 protein of unknown function [Anoxynatronum buryatiense]